MVQHTAILTMAEQSRALD